jgi:hypothetical protein
MWDYRCGPREPRAGPWSGHGTRLNLASSPRAGPCFKVSRHFQAAARSRTISDGHPAQTMVVEVVGPSTINYLAVLLLFLLSPLDGCLNS